MNKFWFGGVKMLKIITRIYKNTGNTDVLTIAVEKGWISETQREQITKEKVE